ncbi:MAG: chemotaxis-specific protein-glutamate methyltransferase CheB [Desulfobacteraceae bacterium]|nr:chemotaxis-specific protein-glutamate methyltransferase CheB [Desulfobacteraceae bacterium]
MKPVRILIVDDSALVRDFLAEILAPDKEIEVVGNAGNGFEALEKIAALKPDLVTMDIEMPEMNGMVAIEHIMGGENSLPILVVTSLDDSGTAYDAISRGALEVMPKPDMKQLNAESFAQRIKLLSKVKVVRHIRSGSYKNNNSKRRSPVWASPKIIAIASSTGGPGVLAWLFGGLEHSLDVPVVVAQHIARGFDTGLVKWLNRNSPNAHIKKGVPGETLKPGVIYLSPSYGHMEITPRNTIEVYPPGPADIYTPSCDRLLTSVARTHGQFSMAIVLTGMGNDGTAGAQAVKQSGGTTIAQDKATSVVYGMPRAAVESGCIDQVMSLNEIGRCLNVMAREGS